MHSTLSVPQLHIPTRRIVRGLFGGMPRFSTCARYGHCLAWGMRCVRPSRSSTICQSRRRMPRCTLTRRARSCACVSGFPSWHVKKARDIMVDAEFLAPYKTRSTVPPDAIAIGDAVDWSQPGAGGKSWGYLLLHTGLDSGQTSRHYLASEGDWPLPLQIKQVLGPWKTADALFRELDHVVPLGGFERDHIDQQVQGIRVLYLVIFFTKRHCQSTMSRNRGLFVARRVAKSRRRYSRPWTRYE